MKRFLVLNLIAAIGAGAVLLWTSNAAAVQEGIEKAPEGVEVLTRGPMHEAYAAPQSLNVAPMPIVPKKPPEPVPEVPPDQKPDGSHVVWISGYWAWDDEPADFIWISGLWRDAPPGKRWLPGHWLAVQGGWQWTQGFWAPDAETQVSYLPPPPPSVETGPSAAAPDADSFYSPGCWVYVERQYRWRPGFWLKYRPNWAYIPAHHCWTPAGCVFVDGYWDYELTRRGLLFCPIRFTANVWTRPNWRWEPHFLVLPEVIVGSLFVRIDFGRYCFGDYFGAPYHDHGFIPWVDYRLHANIPEPLFHQFAWEHRTAVNWERDLRKLYDDRRVGIALRPPRTLIQQQQFMRDVAANRPIKVGERTFAVKDVKLAERNLMMVNTLAKVDRKVVPLRQLTEPQRANAALTVAHHTEVIKERQVTETKIMTGGGAKLNEVHKFGKLPSAPAHLRTPETVVRPAAPAIPAHVERVVPKYEPPRPVRVEAKPLHEKR